MSRWKHRPEIMVVNKSRYEMIRDIVCRRVYRSGGKGRKKRIKWVERRGLP